MSVKDPIDYLRKLAFDNYRLRSITVVVCDGTDMLKGRSIVDTFNKESKAAMVAVADWLDKSGLSIWPYADIERDFDKGDVELTIYMDGAMLTTLYVGGEADCSLHIAKSVTKTLKALIHHVNVRAPKITIKS